MTNNNFIKVSFLLLIIIILNSCITNKDLEYISTNKNLIQTSYDEYVIQKEDLLSVQISSTTKSNYDFFNLQETSNPQLLSQNPYLYGYLVKKDGLVNLPMIGNVKAEGFTISEVEKVIEQISSTYFKDPIVKVNVLNFQVTILGEVNSPGEYNIVRSNQNIFHLIGKANDLTDFANRKRVKVIRKHTDISSRVIFLDLSDKDILNSKDFYLHPQDIIYVEPLIKKFYSVNNLSNAVSISMSALSLYLLIINN
tara:strand:+ start:52099 stop:52857 length:759 start_codon:yes stop_codon:yes gene_type:complete